MDPISALAAAYAGRMMSHPAGSFSPVGAPIPGGGHPPAPFGGGFFPVGVLGAPTLLPMPSPGMPGQMPIPGRGQHPTGGQPFGYHPPSFPGAGFHGPVGRGVHLQPLSAGR